MVLGIQLPLWASLVFFGFWIFSFLQDINSTVKFKGFLKFETNVMVRLFAKRFSPKQSMALQVGFEIFVVFLSSLVNLDWNLSFPGTIALVFGIAHLTAWQNNKKFAKQFF